jgi:hypothetical protein
MIMNIEDVNHFYEIDRGLLEGTFLVLTWRDLISQERTR